MATTAPLAPATSTAYHGATPRLVALAALFTTFGAVAMAASGTGYRFGSWGLLVAHCVLSCGAGLSGLGGVIALVALLQPSLRRHPRVVPIGAASLVAAIITSGTFGAWYVTAHMMPAIRDISTDTADPPRFEVLHPTRHSGRGDRGYGDADWPAEQRAAYPDIRPLMLSVSVTDAFQRALLLAHSFGWQIATADAAAGRIEAMATTPWYGFQNDVVVRLRAQGAETRVDVRSDSRLDESDAGTSASLVRRFMRMLRA